MSVALAEALYTLHVPERREIQPPRLDRSDLFRSLPWICYPFRLALKARALADLGLRPRRATGALAMDVEGRWVGEGHLVRIENSPLSRIFEDDLMDLFHAGELVWLPNADQVIDRLAEAGFPLGVYLADLEPCNTENENAMLERLLEAMKEVLDRPGAVEALKREN